MTLLPGNRSRICLRRGYLSRIPTRIKTWSIVSTVGAVERMSLSVSPLSRLSSIRVISEVKVAEKAITCLRAGSESQTSVTAGANPISIIWSTSSRIRVVIWERSTHPRSIRSWRRPGVAIRIWAPALSPSRCFQIGEPPKSAIELIRIYFDSLYTSSRVWTASSRVGSRMRTCGDLTRESIPLSAGMTNAAVLPLPVWDWTIIFFPARAGGITWDWTSVGVWYPRSVRASRISLRRERVSKDITKKG